MAQMVIDKSAPTYIYHQVKDVIRRQVRDKKLRPGSKIGSVTEMARLFRISPATVAKATAELIDEGVLYSKIGRGTFVAEPSDRKTHTICFVVYSGDYVTQPHFSQIIGGVSRVTEREHYKLQFITSARVVRAIDGAVPYPFIRESKWADGLIVMDDSLEDSQVIRLAEGLPVVLINRRIPGTDIACVRADGKGGTYQSICHLAKLGHKRVGIYLTLESQADQEKLLGYQAAVNEMGLDSDPDIVVDSAKQRDVADMLDALFSLPVRPTAIVVGSDIAAFGALQMLREKNIRVPEDIAIMGFDGCLSDILPDLPLTTMQLPNMEMGKAAADMLLGMINKKEVANKDIVFTPELRVRQTCGGKERLQPVG
ncbi:MAG: substrate-binding domain-containing protein [Planctomycetota bacterium]|nr:substrate-binding domain-containing protein [Planctomycetota bacterium]